MSAQLGGVTVPNVYVQETSRRYIGGDIRRSVNGTAHTNPVRRIRTWEIETRAMPHDQWEELADMYDDAAGGRVMWSPGDGTPSVYVYILEMPDSRSSIPDGESNRMRSTRIVLEEA